MFCLKCGKEIKNDAKFCPYCGAVTSAGGADPAPKPAAPSGQTEGKSGGWGEPVSRKHRGGGLILGGAVAAVLVVAVLVTVLSGLFASPKGQVEKALHKTLSAYAGAKKDLGLPDLMELAQSRSGSQRYRVELNSISQELTWYDLSSLRGIGMRASSDWDLDDRKMDVDVALCWDGEDLASFQMLADDSKLYFVSPDFTKGSAYGINTKTLGADLDRLGADGGEVELKNIGFNLFDLVEIVRPSGEQDAGKALENAWKGLLDAVEVEEAGKQSIQVNGKSLEADAYHVVITKDAMKTFINDMEDAFKTVDAKDMMKKILQSMGFDKSTINELLSEMDSTDVYGELASLLKQAVKTIGDVELEVYVSGGYIVAAEYSQRIEGVKVKASLYLGGGSNYVDDFSMEISAGDAEVLVESSGDHAGKNGVFTDETTVRVRSGGSDDLRVTSDLRYEPKASKGNFEWEVKLDSIGSVQMEGQLTTTKDSVDLSLEDVTLKAAGTKLLSLAVDYYLGPCEGMTVSVSSAKMLSDMDEDDLEDLYYDLEDNAEDWYYDIQDRIPDALAYLF